MEKNTKIILSILRIALGFLFLYAGVSKFLTPNWSAAGYLKSAKTFSGLYHWFASAQNIGWVNFLNEWGLTLIGIALVIGVLVRLASYSGVLIMALYYFPILKFPMVGDHSFLIDEHVIYILILLLVASVANKDIFSLKLEKLS